MNHQPSTITHQPADDRSQVQVAVTNLTPRQQRFLADVLALLSDPAHAADLAAVERGAASLVMRANGRALVLVERSPELDRN